MIDLKLLVNDFDSVAEKLSWRNIDATLLDTLRESSISYKKKKIALEELQAEQNMKTKLFAKCKQEGGDINALKNECDGLKVKIDLYAKELEVWENKLQELTHNIPNIPDSKTPFGKDERDNVELKKVLEIPRFDFQPKEHWELAEQNGWIDFERGVKLAKSRFSVFMGMGAKIERALMNYMLDFNSARGFSEVGTPAIANAQTLFGVGQLPKFEEDLFKISDFKDEEKGKGHALYLIPTAEATLTNLYSDEILKEDMLPMMLTAYTPCFRKEAGSAGRDTRGIIRQHQFDKVELVALTTPQESDMMQERMISCASELLISLGLPHRLMQLCSGDLGFSASNTVDIEVWLPGQNCYREISSISNTRDFQARRAKIRYKDSNKKNRLVHTLNGSSLAVGRTLVAIMENYQNADGSITIPPVLESYLR
ncbi:serine--tRNA ligase [Helicobacter turcicus]|uniref:Serine--tRNA ligase n=1 Tax=Helicobacter turcicus TaxID=2867412 RepID=A0ABS7JL34_9HELI|nr:serine--tRNA ligase [Helicobacter turcicus]MBX7490109.1 serine--tRNA ligase [Helicobacter turcicus]MBX7544968.1 serine--tRNA ligase [Helicobacter turcicus]